MVLISLLIQGWTIALTARRLHIALPRADVSAHRVELDLPGQLGQELVGFPVVSDSPYLRRGITPSWAKLTLVIRDERVHTPEEAGRVREGDHVYFLAPPERAQALDRFFVEMPSPARPDPAMLGDFFVSGEVVLGALAEVYGLPVRTEDAAKPLGAYFAERLGHPPHSGDAVRLGPVTLLAHTVKDGHVVTVGLQLADPEPRRALRPVRRLRVFIRRMLARLRRRR